jgi:predicted amidohydrolase YtcJ
MLVIHNANIHTLNPLQAHAYAIAIQHGQVVALGNNDEILSAFASSTRLDACGRTIIPGLTDSHIHLEDYAFNLQKIDCETATRNECLKRVAARALNTPPGAWILGHGWNQNNWDESYGSAALLDEISTQNPIYLTHKSLHCGWANSAALRLAGITRNTPDPLGGRISRLPDGEPDGILFESATDLLEQAIPAPSLEQTIDALRDATHLLIRFGLTGVHDFDSRRCFSALQVLHANHELKLRVLKGIPRENLSHAIDLGLRSGFGDDFLRIGSVKLFADGALGPHTAAMLQPYEGEPANLGILMMETRQLYELGRQAVGNGISMAVHAIGDRANRVVLDAYAQLRDYEQSLPSLSANKPRHRIEHVQVIHPDDLSRFAQLDVIASMQPIHATSDMHMADRSWGARSANAYAWRSLIENHAHLAFGSDAPVESPNPFWGIHAAVTRMRANEPPSQDGWYPAQRLNVNEALHAYTTEAAYASGMDDHLGKLAPGYLADLLLLDEDPFSCEVERLRDIRPLAAMVGGEWVYFNL